MVKLLDDEDPTWRDTTFWVWDCATYHKASKLRELIDQLRVPVIFSGPYSYYAAPIELYFALLKRGDLSQNRGVSAENLSFEQVAGSTKSYEEVVEMTISRASRIPRATIISLWHEAILAQIRLSHSEAVVSPRQYQFRRRPLQKKC